MPSRISSSSGRPEEEPSSPFVGAVRIQQRAAITVVFGAVEVGLAQRLLTASVAIEEHAELVAVAAGAELRAQEGRDHFVLVDGVYEPHRARPGLPDHGLDRANPQAARLLRPGLQESVILAATGTCAPAPGVQSLGYPSTTIAR
jgi:hypothetical protein